MESRESVEQMAPASKAAPEATPWNVFQEEAQAAREEVAQRQFVPPGTSPPDEVLPHRELITIIDQGSDATSVGVAVAAVVNYLRAERGESRPVSGRMLYELARRYDEYEGSDYEGSSLWGAVAGLARNGVCLEAEWPLGDPVLRSSPVLFESARKNRPAAVQWVEKDIDHLRAAVFENHAVVVSAELHDGWMQPHNGVIPFESKRQKSTFSGGHAFAVIGYTREGFLVQNSWGQEWGGVKAGTAHLPGVGLWKYEDAAANLLDAWIVQLSVAPYRVPLVGYDADSISGDDLLEIKAEVASFSYVLASRSIKPPLALGLFGDWGGGKSFFMQEMQQKIVSLAELAARPREANDGASPFCRHIVQIRFNAWHYLDTDLWASLVTEIFERLFEAVGGKSDKPEERRGELSDALYKANGVYQRAKQQQEDASNASKKAKDALAAAIKAREEREGKLMTQLDDLGTLLMGNPELRGEVDRLAGELGVPELKSSFRVLETRANEVKNTGLEGRAVVQTILSSPWGRMRVATLVLAVTSPLLIVAGIEFLRSRWGLQIETFHSFALQVSTLLAAVGSWVGVQGKRAADVLNKLKDTNSKLERIREERRARYVAEEKGAVETLREEEEAARKNFQEAQQRVQTLQREIQDLQPGRLIMRFIEERSKSSDYRSRLGIVSLVRRDFERLSELADPDNKKHDPVLMPVERIILYIDDLDRCKPDRVIEVLEAVHLLLAFPLFMVVVAVDPRWLSHCLEKQYPDLLVLRTREAGTGRRGSSARPATAQDYLEKIFQIPFTLQPLKGDGFRRLIRGLTELNRMPEAEAPVAGRVNAPGSLPELAGTSPSAGGASGGAGSGSEAIKARAKQAARDQTAVEEEAESEESAIERLGIRAWEYEDMERLAPLFRTPRAVKRFVNTYRFLRAGVKPQYIGRFEGVRDDPGTYRGALALLAIVVSSSNIAPQFLDRLVRTLESGHGTLAWSRFLREARADVHSIGTGDADELKAKSNGAGARSAAKTREKRARGKKAETVARTWEEIEWVNLCDALSQVSGDDFPVREIRALEEWIPTVSRYSFSLSSAAALQRERV